jgi:hypothetical protein
VASTKVIDSDEVERVDSIKITLSFAADYHASLSYCSTALHQKGSIAFESVVVHGITERGGQM